MKVFSVSLTASVEVSLRGGNFFMLIDTSAPLNVSLVSGGVIQETAESVEAGFKAMGRAENEANGARYFDEARLLSATAQTVRVGISDGSGGYDRALGEVVSEQKLTQLSSSPIGYDALTNNNFCHAGAATQGAVASEFSHIQILNPAGSGKILYVDNLMASVGAASHIDLLRYDTALTTAVAARSLKIGGAAGIGQVRTQTFTTLVGTGDLIAQIRMAADAPFDIFKYQSPIIIAPGEGIVARCRLANTGLSINGIWREYA